MLAIKNCTVYFTSACIAAAALKYNKNNLDRLSLIIACT
jgi:hypothetical protein